MPERQHYGDDVRGSKSGRDYAERDVINIYQDGIDMLARRMDGIDEALRDQKTVSAAQWQGAFRALGLLSEEQFEHGTLLRQQAKSIETLTTELAACKSRLNLIAGVAACNTVAAVILLIVVVARVL
jgi:hypothetical protein